MHTSRYLYNNCNVLAWITLCLHVTYFFFFTSVCTHLCFFYLKVEKFFFFFCVAFRDVFKLCIFALSTIPSFIFRGEDPRESSITRSRLRWPARFPVFCVRVVCRRVIHPVSSWNQSQFPFHARSAPFCSVRELRIASQKRDSEALDGDNPMFIYDTRCIIVVIVNINRQTVNKRAHV